MKNNSVFEDSMEMYLQERTVGDQHRTSLSSFLVHLNVLITVGDLGTELVIDKKIVVDMLSVEQHHSRKLKAFKVSFSYLPPWPHLDILCFSKVVLLKSYICTSCLMMFFGSRSRRFV